MIREEAVRLVRNIRFESADKDNMEFTARVSCYQRDAIEELIRLADSVSEAKEPEIQRPYDYVEDSKYIRRGLR